MHGKDQENVIGNPDRYLRFDLKPDWKGSVFV